MTIDVGEGQDTLVLGSTPSTQQPIDTLQGIFGGGNSATEVDGDVATTEDSLDVVLMGIDAPTISGGPFIVA